MSYATPISTVQMQMEREREKLFGNGFSQVELKILPKKTKILHSIGVLVCCFSHLKVRLKCRASVKNISEWPKEQETSPPYGNLVSSSVSAALCIRHDQAQIESREGIK